MIMVEWLGSEPIFCRIGPVFFSFALPFCRSPVNITILNCCFQLFSHCWGQRTELF